MEKHLNNTSLFSKSAALTLVAVNVVLFSNRSISVFTRIPVLKYRFDYTGTYVLAIHIVYVCTRKPYAFAGQYARPRIFRHGG